ncbi:peptidoglycan hydrolase CwlO-like protein [Anaerosolibacter carboniphilus]|uniref:Peptidoglycan hydrolase CwlO-like protein n=1 Tax=Anaerosolibacter carboniphilus TaxID=1417629 RepID=A0A841KRT3_9FIRM|nr:hypothetical protein [Anaerosolibacter carboniphilus]MBB6216127.1 peptidoglycan hydrolase CwlO-like protein [Anaerosolibacter carboniphilus]
MLKKGKMKLVLIFSIILVLMFFSIRMAEGQRDSSSEIQEKLAGISEEERQILQNLFTIAQEIKEIEKEEERIGLEKDTILEEIEALKGAVENEEIAYEKKKTVLKEVLKTYQKRGPGTYLEIMLDADSLTTLIRRINALRDLTRNTGELLDGMEASREKLSVEKTKLDEKLILLEEKQNAARESLNKKVQLMKEQEAYLNSLNDEKEHYQAQLANVQQMWDELKSLFSKISDEFSSMTKADKLPSNAIKTSITLFGIKGSIEEETFNNIIKENPSLLGMTLRFYPGRVDMNLPKKNLVLSGKFVILEGNILKFDVKEGSFYGMPLGSGAIEELMQEGYPTMNLKPLVGGNVLKSIELSEGKLEFLVMPK